MTDSSSTLGLVISSGVITYCTHAQKYGQNADSECAVKAEGQITQKS